MATMGGGRGGQRAQRCVQLATTIAVPACIMAAYFALGAGLFYLVDGDGELAGLWRSTHADFESTAGGELLLALKFAMTAVSTIGYGRLYMESTWGRAATVLYAAVGIPLVAYLLTQLGQNLCKLAWRNYIVATCGRRAHEDDDAGDALSIFDDSYHSIPFWVALLTLSMWMLVGVLFIYLADGYTAESGHEAMTLGQTIYFFIISITTIGFGDLHPCKLAVSLVSYIYILGGIAMLSMCFELLQSKLTQHQEQLRNNMRSKILNELADENDEQAKDDPDAEEKEADDGTIETFLKSKGITWKQMRLMGATAKRKLAEALREADQYACAAAQTEPPVDKAVLTEPAPPPRRPQRPIVRSTTRAVQTDSVQTDATASLLDVEQISLAEGAPAPAPAPAGGKGEEGAGGEQKKEGAGEAEGGAQAAAEEGAAAGGEQAPHAWKFNRKRAESASGVDDPYVQLDDPDPLVGFAFNRKFGGPAAALNDSFKWMPRADKNKK